MKRFSAVPSCLLICKTLKWSESIAVGSESLIMMTKEKLGIKAKGRMWLVRT